MLLDNFFKIVHKTVQSEAVNYRLEFNAAHPVFQGHFPGNHVVPGVFIIQAVHELTESSVGKKLRLAEAKKIKFLSVVDPRLDNQLTVRLSVIPGKDNFAVEAAAFFREQPCLKLHARFQQEI